MIIHNFGAVVMPITGTGQARLATGLVTTGLVISEHQFLYVSLTLSIKSESLVSYMHVV